MTTMQRIYFISAWVVAGAALIALILYLVGWGGTLGFGAFCESAFIGITGCFFLLYLSGWFRNETVLFILAWVVAGLAVLALILSAVGGFGATVYIPYYGTVSLFGGTSTIGAMLRILALGGLCTFLMLHLSGRFSEG